MDLVLANNSGKCDDDDRFSTIYKSHTNTYVVAILVNNIYHYDQPYSQQDML